MKLPLLSHSILLPGSLHPRYHANSMLTNRCNLWPWRLSVFMPRTVFVVRGLLSVSHSWKFLYCIVRVLPSVRWLDSCEGRAAVRDKSQSSVYTVQHTWTSKQRRICTCMCVPAVPGAEGSSSPDSTLPPEIAFSQRSW